MRKPLVVAALLIAVAAGQALSQDGTPDPSLPVATTGAPASIALELNKLVAGETGCEAYVVAENRTPQALKELTVDTYFFDAKGVILSGVALRLTDLRAGRPTVVPFQLPDLSCGDISRILLNKVLTCTDMDGAAVAGCAELISVSTRADIAFEY